MAVVTARDEGDFLMHPKMKAQKALAVYVKRGYNCMSILETQGADAFLAKLAERDQAFANFKCHDQSAAKASAGTEAKDPQDHAEIDRLLAEAQAQNQELAALLQAALTALEGELGKINQARQVTRLYQSGYGPEERFRKAT